MASRTIVILSSGVNGPRAAARARETNENARIILLENGRETNWAAASLVQLLAKDAPPLAAVHRERTEFLRDILRVEVRSGVTAQKIYSHAHKLETNKGEIPYDTLIYALEAKTQMPELPGLAGTKNTFGLFAYDELKAVAALLQRGAKRFAVIGAGFLGVELAAVLAGRKCKVTLVESQLQILPELSRQVSLAAESELQDLGVTMLTGKEIWSVDVQDNKVKSLRLKDSSVVAVDAVIFTSSRPDVELVREAGARLHADGTLQVDDTCKTTVADIYACGTSISLPHTVTTKNVWVQHAAQAEKSAQIAGTNAAGGLARIQGILGTRMAHVGALTFARTGLTDLTVGPDVGAVTVQSPAHDPRAAGVEKTLPLLVQVFFHKRNSRVLGIEIVGDEGVDKRLDVFTTAIAGNLLLEQLAYLDLGYLPEFSLPRDAVNEAAYQALTARQNLAVSWRVRDLAERRNGAVLVDVRSPAERKKGTVEGALGIPLANLRKRLPEFATKKLIFLSEKGRRSYLAARMAQMLGNAEAGYLSGGLHAWSAEGQPLVKTR